MKKVLLIVFLFSIMVSHSGVVMTWVPPYQPHIGKSWDNLNADFGGVGMKDGLTHLALQFWLPTLEGGLEKDTKYELEDISDSVIAKFVKWGDENDVKTLLCVYNNDGKWNWSLARAGFITHRESFMASLINEMERLNFDGIELDLEGQGVTSKSDRAALLSFVAELSVKLREKGKELTIATYASEWHTPGTNMWTDLAPHVDAITSMGYHEMGIEAPGFLGYEFQKKWLKVDHGGLLMGVPAWKGAWLGNTAEEQLDWIVADGAVGVGIWDASLSNNRWKSAEVWERLKAIKEDLGPLSSTALSSGVLLSSSSEFIDAVFVNDEVRVVVAGRESELSDGEWQLLNLNGELSAFGGHSKLKENLRVQESGVYFLRVSTDEFSRVFKIVLE